MIRQPPKSTRTDTPLPSTALFRSRRITRTGAASWTIEPWVFFESGGSIRQPYRKFARDEVTLAASGTTGTVTLAASADLFESGHVGTRFRIQDKEVAITAVGGPTTATAEVKQTLAGTAATKDWAEQAFSAVRGWPVSVVFQDRKSTRLNSSHS